MKKILVFSLLASLSLIFACGGKDGAEPAPIADFSFVPTTPAINQDIAFVNNSTNATKFEWNFGDNTTSTDRNPVKKYTVVGNYTVKLTATGGGGTKTVEKTVSVIDPTAEVVADFTFSPASPVVEGTEIQFINNTLNATSISWDFGSADITIVSGSATDRNPRVKYNKAGNFTVKMTGTNVKGPKTKEANLVVNVDLGKPLELTGNLTNQTLDATRKYLLKGQVVIPDGVTLTVPAGTVIFGEKASKAVLIVNRGGKLICNGTATNPIVFTSNQEVGARDKGDWGGVVMLGRARTNQANPSIEGLVGFNFGGTDDSDNSGSLKYVRIEYAGIEFTPNNETNSLTMGGLGSGTTLEYIQVSFGGDDGFEWFGGKVNAKWLISFGMWDDDFDCDFGFTGKVQYGLAVRYPSYADQSGSTFYEVDNDAQGSPATPFTAPTFSNMTLIGPRLSNELRVRNRANTADSTARRASTINANFTQALHFRRNCEIGLFNSIITGYPTGLRIDDNATFDAYQNSVLIARNYMIMPGGTNVATNATSFNATDVTNIWNRPTGTEANVLINPGSSVNNRRVEDFLDSLGLATSLFWGSRLDNNYNNGVEPDFKVAAGKPFLTGASFTNSRLSDSFFNKNNTFIGAFGNTTDWTDNWANFNPKDKQY
jgi:PKD repeat protein